MKNIPFSVYDFLAYLSAGIVLIATVDVIYGASWLLQDKVPLVLGIVGLFVAYIVGHAVAHMSSVIIENWMLGRVLGRPSTLLMSGEHSRWRYLFPNYFKALPETTRERIGAKLLAHGFEGDGEARFLHIFGTMKGQARVDDRLQIFLNLYGFSRNICLAMTLSGVIALVGPLDDRPLSTEVYGLAMLLTAVVMFYRYLKFFRQYSHELLITYSESKDKES